MEILRTGRLSSGSGCGALRPHSWRKVCTLTPPRRLSRCLFGALLLAALAGCSTTRFVTVPCLTQEQLAERQKAEPPKVSDRLSGNAGEDIKTIAGSAIRLRAWGLGNLQILEGCREK